MQLHVNGEQREFGNGLSVAALLGELALDQQQVAVELNRQVVPRTEHARTLLQEGDELEVVTLVGGG